MPLGVLTVVVLAVILFGISPRLNQPQWAHWARFILRSLRSFRASSHCGPSLARLWAWLLGLARADFVELIVSGSLGAMFAGTAIPISVDPKIVARAAENIKEATFLTAKTTAMVCWLFIGSALFSAVFALHGGQSLIERWVLSMNCHRWSFMFTRADDYFLLGWPLEWTEIIVIFCPIFLPLLNHFQIDPLLFGTMVQ